MLEYLIKRILIMIPTFLGASLMIWLVMTMSPGEPGASAGGGMDDIAAGGALKDLESKNRVARAFRKQYNLNRPRFWNDWADLSQAEIIAQLKIVDGGVKKFGTTPVKDARRKLEDWQEYAVPGLISILGKTVNEPGLNNTTLQNLRQSAYTFRPDYAKGHIPTEAERTVEKYGSEQNRLIQTAEFSFGKEAKTEERARVAERWKQWQQDNPQRFDYQGFWNRISDTQFGKYWGDLLTGDLGTSMSTKEPVLDMIMGRMKYSLSLALPSFVIAWLLAIFLGVFSATHHGKPSDQILSVGVFMLYSIPAFVMATLLQQWLCVEMKAFPLSGFESQGAKTELTTWAHLKDVLHHITLPMICWIYGSFAYISRQARSGMLQVLKSDFVRTARAKGVKERHVIWRHAVRNGMMPIVTLLGTALPILVAGSVFIEMVFDIDGFGRLMINAIFQKDYNVVMGVQLIVAALTLVGLLLTDLIYAAMDPRISFK